MKNRWKHFKYIVHLNQSENSSQNMLLNWTGSCSTLIWNFGRSWYVIFSQRTQDETHQNQSFIQIHFGSHRFLLGNSGRSSQELWIFLGNMDATWCDHNQPYPPGFSNLARRKIAHLEKGICQQPAMFDDIKMDQPISTNIPCWYSMLSHQKYPHEISTILSPCWENCWLVSDPNVPWIFHGLIPKICTGAFPRQHFQTFEVTPKPILRQGEVVPETIET